MILKQLFDYDTWTYTYLLADEVSKEAVIIDTVSTQIERDITLIKELGLTLKFAVDTHVHADHITAAGKLRDRLGCKTGVAAINAVDCADLALEDGQHLSFGQYKLKVIATPGHTAGCLSFAIDQAVFTGDSLFIRGCGRTDFQQGNAGALYDSITIGLFSLPDSTIVYPGHDYHGHTCSTIAEEKAFNPRLSMDRRKFIAYMDSLDLPNPKRIMEAVPGNMACGKPVKDQ